MKASKIHGKIMEFKRELPKFIENHGIHMKVCILHGKIK
jgi:hypothetical protein